MKLEELKSKLQIAVERINLSIEGLNAELLEKYHVPFYTKNPASGEIKEWKKGKYHRYLEFSGEKTRPYVQFWHI